VPYNPLPTLHRMINFSITSYFQMASNVAKPSQYVASYLY